MVSVLFDPLDLNLKNNKTIRRHYSKQDGLAGGIRIATDIQLLESDAHIPHALASKPVLVAILQIISQSSNKQEAFYSSV